jgi:murein DD-endopeptidase MepM/ murein hydrolase activator NlpD
MSRSLSSIVRRVLLEDVAFRGFNLGVRAAKSARFYTARSSDLSGEAEEMVGQPISASGDGTSGRLLGSVKPSWGGDYATGADSHRKRPLGNWESDNAWDVFASPGTSVYSLTKGTVSVIRRATPGANVKVYGDMVIIKGTAGNADMYYTHIDSAVKKGAQVNPGDLIGVILNPQSAGSSAEMPPHVHIGMNDGTYVANKADPSKSRGGGNLSRYVKEDGTILSAMTEEPVASGEDETPSTG